MPSDTHPDSRSPPVTTGGARPPPAEPGQPPAGSGFGALLQQEHELRARIAGSLAEVDGPHAIAIGRILDNQQTRIADNIALLEQRHDTFPDLARTEAMRGRVPRWTGDPAGGERSSTRLLSRSSASMSVCSRRSTRCTRGDPTASAASSSWRRWRATTRRWRGC